MYLLPETIDDDVAEDNPVRFLDVSVEKLDLEGLGFQHATPAATGRPPYHPGDLLRLYLCGCLNRIRSSRRLEKEAVRNLELMWLARKLRPDFKTTADVRKENRVAIKRVCREFTLLCRQLERFGGQLVAIDGSTCALRPECTRNKENRRITRWAHEEVLERMQQRVSDHPELMRTRKMLVEHPFGTIKRWMDQGYFLMRGNEKVSAEASLTVLAYHIKRAINIVGVNQLVHALA